jgi:hypothetical protein
MNGQILFQIYQSALLERRTMGSFKVYWFLLALTLGLPLIPLLLHIKLANTVALLIFVSMLYALLLSMLPQLVVNGLRLATPHHNQTLPGLARHLYWSFGIVIFSASIILALLASLVLGHFLLLFLGICSSLLMMSFLYTPGDAKFAIPLAIVLGILSFTWLPGFVVRSGLWAGRPLPAAMALALVLLMFHLLARRIFAVKGERAWFVQKKLNGYTELITTGTHGKASSMAMLQKQGAAYFYDASLARAIQRPADKSRLFIFGLGYGLHWSFVAVALFWLIFFIPMGAAVFFLIAGNFMVALNAIMGFLGVMILAMAFVTLQQGFACLEQTRQEQQLLKLLPTGLIGHGYNRLLATSFLRQIGLAYAGIVLLNLLVMALLPTMGVAPQKLHAFNLLSTIIATLPMALAALVNYASLKNHYRNTWYFYLIAPMALIVLPLVDPTTFWIAAAIIVIATLAGLKLSWQQTLAAPVAIPVGRLAKP